VLILEGMFYRNSCLTQSSANFSLLGRASRRSTDVPHYN